MPGLASSRWASAKSTMRSWPQPISQTSYNSIAGLASGSTQFITPSPSPTPTPVPSVERSASPTPEKELARYLKIVARLKWKLPFLDQGYRIAIDRTGRSPEDAAANEIHFKIDFYEYYMHIERALVHLMGVFGIKVYGLADSRHNPTGNNDLKVGENGNRLRMGQHRYHANVLAAFENPENPLHEALGKGEVRKQLQRAKELRNRWKNADEAGGEEMAFIPLEAYNLEQIINTVLSGLDQAFLVACAHVESLAKANGRPLSKDMPSSPQDWDREEQEWNFVVDAMDWSAM